MNTARTRFLNPQLSQLLVLSLLMILLYYPTFHMFLYDWSHDDNYSHGFLVPFISGYLVWTKRKKLARLSPQLCWSGLPVLLTGLAMYVVGTIGVEWFLRRFSLVIVIAGLVLYLYGKAFFRELLFPIVFLAFMVPVPAIIYKGIAFQLQLFVSIISAKLIPLAGVALYREGNILYVSTGPLAVEEACSGMRSIMALLALSSLFAYLMYESRLKQWILTIFALPIAVITNIIRVTVTGIMAHYWGKEFAEGILHESFGWMVFVIAFILLYLLSRALDLLIPSTPTKHTKTSP
ncbi:exosortase [candidate division KSB3 bacterium]|uniref:Exosortase n=1 Tax=candidate division KSB3 bacterium TaxID=2044937 RepID=A0A2G6E1J2_9BACT|nr:MAG: exosortase [candidate division KSB3 bacterium]PIE28571.1 MAG: exosortase [candidate division KSB3 bacterium]